jgi:hypothetical protein
MQTTNTSDLVAAFLARGGSVAKLPTLEPKEGVSRQRALARRVRTAHLDFEDAVRVRPEPQDSDDDDRVTIVTDHCGREFYRNSAGEWL